VLAEERTQFRRRLLQIGDHDADVVDMRCRQRLALLSSAVRRTSSANDFGSTQTP
jgi:hypothetical protein